MTKLTELYLQNSMDLYFSRLSEGQSSEGDLTTLHDSLLSDSEFRELFCDWVKMMRALQEDK